MPTEVLYRKWRPQRFADVCGQDVVKRTLTNALKAGAVSHAYLFSGPRGTGKTTMGRLLTKAINCERNAPDVSERAGEPCNECASCVEFNEGRALDLIELDGASNRGIDDIRDLREKVGYAPMSGGSAHKVYLIDEVHMLTEQAFNALLKTLEEPPPHIVFILATTDAHKVPQTIVSRCQRQDFKRIPVAATVERLAFIAEQEGITIPREGLEAIARQSTGSLRDAINLLEQVCDSHGKDPSLEAVRESLGLIADDRAAELAERAAHGDLSSSLAIIGAVRDDGIDLSQFQKQVVARLRDLLIVQAGAMVEGAWTPEQVAEMSRAVEGIPRETVVRLLKLLSEADLRQDKLSPLPLELAIAEAILPVSAPATAAAAPAPRPAPAPAPRPVATSRPASPARPPAPSQRPAPPRTAAEPPRESVPPSLRKDNITGASAEDIARMVGSNTPVIPPAGDEPDAPAPSAATTPDAPAPAAADQPVAPTAAGPLDTAVFIDKQLRPAVRKHGPRFDAYLNGQCHVVSWQDGVLTLGFYQEFNKSNVEGNRKLYEDAATDILGAPVALRCIMAARPARAITKSPLVQHAVRNPGVRIVSEQ